MFGTKHKMIERFSVIFLSLALCMSVLLVSIVVRKNAADKNRLSNQAVYTTQVAMSRSHVTGEVVDIMVNEDKTKTFVLWKMSDMSMMSANAKDYMMFLTGSTETKYNDELLSQPSGGLYVFGVSGYMGAYLVNNEPYPSQILNLVVRAVKDYSSDTNVGSVPDNGDESFASFDQLQIYFNPGAGGTHHVKCLDKEKLDVEELYKEAVISIQKNEIKQTLEDDLRKMFESRRLMDQYVETLTNGVLGSVMAEPEMPEFVQADEIAAYTLADDTKLTWSDEANSWVDEDAKLTYNADSYYYKLDTDYVFDGGFNYNWQDEPKEGYLEELRGTSTIDEYLTQQEELYNAAQKAGELSFQPENIKFYYGDGAEFVPNVNSTDSKVQNISKVCNQLTEQLRVYYDLRLKYQTQDLKDLLYLERDSIITSATYSENFEDGVLTNY